LAELTQEAAAHDGQAPVLDAAAVLERADWTQPRMARRFSSLVRGILAEAELLGLIGSGALSQIGAAIAAEQPDEAMNILGEHLPAALNHVLLQADLTAVAPGYLAPDLTEKLLTMADAEGQGPATIYRFSVASVRRALDAGQDAQAMLDFLGLHSATAIPQPLKYLIEDTAARHARLRVGSAASFIQSDDEMALLELLNTPGAAGLGLVRIAPTVLVSHAAPRETAQLLRSLGLSPAVDDSESGGIRLRRTTAVPGSEEATQLGLETLQKAIRLKQRVVMNVVDGMGNAVRETVVPVAVNGGRVRVFDPDKETERVLSIHRIIDVEAAEEMLQ
ncbi:MAG TPA: helicase-associated domain-containing protein, partial [Arthrobacter sp.]|nr:helicase-associated domain-containing protein [Arthrobacter sp.]